MNGITPRDDFEEVRVPVPWGVITGKWWGPRHTQPVIALHGWQDNSGTYDNLAPILRDKGISLYCVDLPGHGFSSHMPQGQSYFLFWDGVQFVRRIVRHFGWKDITLMGHSLGGAISFLYTAAYPNEVKKLISIDIVSPTVRTNAHVVDNMGKSVDKFLDYEEKSKSDPPAYEYEDMVDFVFDAHNGSLTRDSAEIMLRRGMRPVKGENKYVFTRDPRLKVAGLGHVSLEQSMEMASRITCEVLNIRAGKGIKFESYDAVLDKLEKSAKKLERHLIEGTHHLHLNDAESVAPCIYKFLAS